jgi:hypothetical protein
MKKSLVLLFGSGLLFTIACAGDTSRSADLQELMKEVAVQAQVIWDVGAGAIDDEGNPDGSKLNAADWDSIVSAGGKGKNVAKSLVEAKQLVIAAPGQKISGEENPGAFNAQDVEHAIAANPQAFSGFAQALEMSMDEIVNAARTRDAAKLFEVSGSLDQICEQCHLQFWYPEQNAAR